MRHRGSMPAVVRLLDGLVQRLPAFSRALVRRSRAPPAGQPRRPTAAFKIRPMRTSVARALRSGSRASPFAPGGSIPAECGLRSAAVRGVVEPGADHDRPELGLRAKAERGVELPSMTGL